MYLYIISLFAFLHLIKAAPVDKMIVDMTHTFDENTINHPSWTKKFEIRVVQNGTIGKSW